MAGKKKDTGYRVALVGARGIIRLLIYVCGAFLIILIGKQSYDFGYDVFNQEPVAGENHGQDVVVQITSDMSVEDTGELLAEKGLIDVSTLVFQAQVRLMDYQDSLVPGTYILNTSQNVEEMLEILSGENTEGQPQMGEPGEEPTPTPEAAG